MRLTIRPSLGTAHNFGTMGMIGIAAIAAIAAFIAGAVMLVLSAAHLLLQRLHHGRQQATQAQLGAFLLGGRG